MGIFSIKEGGNISEKKISIARNFNLTKEELRDLLLHEMIHECMYMKYRKMNHNRQFVKKMNELNKKYGFDIRRNSKHLFKKYKPQKSIFDTIIGLFKKLKRLNFFS